MFIIAKEEQIVEIGCQIRPVRFRARQIERTKQAMDHCTEYQTMTPPLLRSE